MAKLPLPDLLANIVSMRQTCVFMPDMAPVVLNGVAWAGNIASVPDPAPGLSVEDFVLGYSAIGWPHVPIISGDFGTAIGVNYDPLPTTWRYRAVKLHRAFGGDFGPVRDYFRDTGLGVLLANLEDSEWITRYGTPRRALIANAITPELRRAAYWPTVRERALFAEPNATDAEIGEAAALALRYLAAALSQNDAYPQSHMTQGFAGSVGRNDSYPARPSTERSEGDA